jgi:hypothetical protein
MLPYSDKISQKMAISYFIVSIYHVFFTVYLLMDTCWFYTFNIENCVTKKHGIQLFLSYVTFISFGYIPSSILVAFLDHILALLLIFLSNFHTIFHNDCTNLQPTAYKDSFFSTPLLAFICCLFNVSCSNRSALISHCDFSLHFLNDWWCWNFFIYPWPFVCLLLRNFYLGLLAIFLFGLYFAIDLSSLYSLDINILSDE